MSFIVLNEELAFNGVTQGSVAPFPPLSNGQYIEFTVYIVWGANVSAGKIQIQTAHDPAYAGTWANVGSTIDWAAASSEKYASVTGCFRALRLYVDTTVANGPVSAYVVASTA